MTLLKTILRPFCHDRTIMEFHRLDITAELLDCKTPFHGAEIRLRFKKSKKKPFAEIRYADIPRVASLFNDAERWVCGVLERCNKT